MLNLTPHNRFHVSNGLAVIAAVMLLISSVASFHSGSEIHSTAKEADSAVSTQSSDSDSMNDDVTSKSRGLNLGLLLFRRG